MNIKTKYNVHDEVYIACRKVETKKTSCEHCNRYDLQHIETSEPEALKYEVVSITTTTVDHEQDTSEIEYGLYAEKLGFVDRLEDEVFTSPEEAIEAFKKHNERKNQTPKALENS